MKHRKTLKNSKSGGVHTWSRCTLQCIVDTKLAIVRVTSCLIHMGRATIDTWLRIMGFAWGIIGIIVWVSKYLSMSKTMLHKHSSMSRFWSWRKDVSLNRYSSTCGPTYSSPSRRNSKSLVRRTLKLDVVDCWFRGLLILNLRFWYWKLVSAW